MPALEYHNGRPVLVVYEGESVIISSQDTNQSYCFGVREGYQLYAIYDSVDVQYLQNKCLKLGFCDNFSYYNFNGENVCADIVAGRPVSFNFYGMPEVLSAYCKNFLATKLLERPINGVRQIAIDYEYLPNWQPKDSGIYDRVFD